MISLRNADLVTALTVLTQRPSEQKGLLPTIIRDMYTVTKPLSASEIRETLHTLNDVLRLRLRLWELIPLEWSQYTIG
jgi:mediator of RNA polymerase II transcription subunit 14